MIKLTKPIKERLIGIIILTPLVLIVLFLFIGGLIFGLPLKTEVFSFWSLVAVIDIIIIIIFSMVGLTHLFFYVISLFFDAISRLTNQNNDVVTDIVDCIKQNTNL